MTAVQIADRLQGRRSGAGWIARCPAHEDRGPSLSIGESNGRLLLHCFAGCTVQAICEALQIRVSDLFSSSVEPRPPAIAKAEHQIADLRGRLTPRERDVLPVTVVSCDLPAIDTAIARALALAVEGELVQVVLE